MLNLFDIPFCFINTKQTKGNSNEKITGNVLSLKDKKELNLSSEVFNIFWLGKIFKENATSDWAELLRSKQEDSILFRTLSDDVLNDISINIEEEK